LNQASLSDRPSARGLSLSLFGDSGTLGDGLIDGGQSLAARTVLSRSTVPASKELSSRTNGPWGSMHRRPPIRFDFCLPHVHVAVQMPAPMMRDFMCSNEFTQVRPLTTDAGVHAHDWIAIVIEGRLTNVGQRTVVDNLLGTCRWTGHGPNK
jgi:hypothetical protein